MVAEELQLAWRSGLAGSFAGLLQVIVFMWMRTVMNVQYIGGGGFCVVLRRLWRNGGMRRLYKGFFFALVQNPAVRFGDVAVNSGGILLLKNLLPSTSILVRTVLTTMIGSLWRLFLTPIDTLKTLYQVHGEEGTVILKKKLKSRGILRTFWSGTLAILAASWLGTYPWFATFNFLQEHVPAFGGKRIFHHIRSACIGFSASLASDTVTNWVRVIKSIAQTTEQKGYLSIIRSEMENDNMITFITRGLSTRLYINSIQSIFFVVVWKAVEEHMNLDKALQLPTDVLNSQSQSTRNSPKNVEEVFILGGSRGLGFQLVKEYRNLGYTVHTTYRKREDMNKLLHLFGSNDLLGPEVPRLYVHELDVRNKTQISQLSSKLIYQGRHIKIFVNNAGIARGNLQTQMTVNAFAPFQIIDLLIPKILQEVKVICIISSHMGVKRAVKKMQTRSGDNCSASDKCSYILSKGKCNELFRNHAVQWRSTGIRAYAIHPGFVRTYMENWNPNPDYFGAISPEESAKGISSLCQVQPSRKIVSGAFYDYKGKLLQWRKKI
jgi:NAD(P)-dependent dehydrogenase (short-subunit alcohol dehydrogenase family)